MRRMMIVLMLLVATIMVPVSASAVFYTDRVSWEAAVSGNLLAVDLPGNEEDILPANQSLALPYGGFFNFNVPLERVNAGSVWDTWSSPGSHELLYTDTDDGSKFYADGSFYPDGVNPGIVSAFGFEMQPNLKAFFDIYLHLTDGSEITQSVTGNSGAAFFGWVGNDVIGFSTWSPFISGGYAIGRFVQGGAAPVPEPATMLLLASGLVGLAGLRKKLRSK